MTDESDRLFFLSPVFPIIYSFFTIHFICWFNEKLHLSKSVCISAFKNNFNIGGWDVNDIKWCLTLWYHWITVYLQPYSNLNRAVSLKSWCNYDEILIRADLTCADMPMLWNVYSRWQQVQRMPGEETFFKAACISIGRTSTFRLGF